MAKRRRAEDEGDVGAGACDVWGGAGAFIHSNLYAVDQVAAALSKATSLAHPLAPL